MLRKFVLVFVVLVAGVPSSLAQDTGNVIFRNSTAQAIDSPSGRTCPWAPHKVVAAANAQCGAAVSGLYECGKDSQCNDVCNFVRCLDDAH
jgi:hypothetical protein